MIIHGTYAASTLFYRQGIIVDFARKCFSRVNTYMGFIKSKSACKSLPKGDYLLLFKTSYVKCESCSVDDFESSRTFQLSLVYNKNRKLIIHESSNLKELSQWALDAAKALKLRIRDSASDRRNPKWITI